MKSLMKFLMVFALVFSGVWALQASEAAADKCQVVVEEVKEECSQMSYTRGDVLFAAKEQIDGSIRLVYR